MAIEAILCAQLESVAGLSGKVFPCSAKEGTKAPYLVYLQTGGSTYEALDGYMDLNQKSFELNVVHTSYKNMKSLAELVISKLKGMQGCTISGTLIQKLSIDENSPELYESEVNFFRKIINIKIIY